MANKLSSVDMLMWVSIPTMAMCAICKYADFGFVRFLTATGISITETLCIVVFVESLKERRKNK